MTKMTLPTRALITLTCAALSLVNLPLTTSRPLTPLIPNYTTQTHTPVLLAAAAVAAFISQANAYAIPEVVHLPYPIDLEKRERSRATKRHEQAESSYTPDCTDDLSSITAIPAGHSSLEPVTVTVTVGLPNTTHTSITTTSGSSTTNGTVADGLTSASATRTSSSAIPAPTVDPLLLSAQEAQRLNLAFRSLSADDACTSGERACISNKLAQCSTPSDASDSARWVTQECLINSDPNQSPVCAAVPYANVTGSSTTPYLVANGTTSTSTPVGLGCFNPTDVTRLFSDAGLQGQLPPGAQTSAARGTGPGLNGGFGVGMLFALIAVALL